MGKKVPPLSCIHCLKEFRHQEVFTAFLDENDMVIIASCVADDHPVNHNKEKPNTGWCVLERDYDKYKIIPIK